MKIVGSILSILFLGCKTVAHDDKTASFGFSLPTENGINMHYEVFDVCSTYHYSAKDTLSPHLAKVIWLDANGREKEIVYEFFEGHVPATAIMLYDSLGRVKEEYYRLDEGEDKGFTKTSSLYNDKNQLIRSVSFDYKRRLKKGLDKGIVGSDGCIITENDYEKNKTWDIVSLWEYHYDERGRVIEKFAPICHSSQNRYQYTYTNSGKLLEEKSLENDVTVWIEHYTYTHDGYQFTHTKYEKNGVRKLDWNGKLYPVDTFLYKLDKRNNIIFESVTEEGGRIVSIKKKRYDNNNRIYRYEIYGTDKNLIGFYSYIYITNANPTRRNFIAKAAEK